MMPAEGASHAKTSAGRVVLLLKKINNDLSDSLERRTSNESLPTGARKLDF